MKINLVIDVLTTIESALTQHQLLALYERYSGLLNAEMSAKHVSAPAAWQAQEQPLILLHEKLEPSDWLPDSEPRRIFTRFEGDRVIGKHAIERLETIFAARTFSAERALKLLTELQTASLQVLADVAQINADLRPLTDDPGPADAVSSNTRVQLITSKEPLAIATQSTVAPRARVAMSRSNGLTQRVQTLIPRWRAPSNTALLAAVPVVVSLASAAAKALDLYKTHLDSKQLALKEAQTPTPVVIQPEQRTETIRVVRYSVSQIFISSNKK